MTDRYDRAADRHFRVAELLERENEIEDAAYHYGLVGENALKHALRRVGVEHAWAVSGKDLRRGSGTRPFPALAPVAAAVAHDMPLFANGRIGAALRHAVSDPSFARHFGGWSMTVRYADDSFTPVAADDCRRWAEDADYMLRTLVQMV